MKRLSCTGLAGIFLIAGCSTMNRPYISGEDACDEIVDPRARLDCIERADQAEDRWREEKRREGDDKAPEAASAA